MRDPTADLDFTTQKGLLILERYLAVRAVEDVDGGWPCGNVADALVPWLAYDCGFDSRISEDVV